MSIWKRPPAHVWKRPRPQPEMSGLACAKCAKEYSAKAATRSRGYCPNCGLRLHALIMGQANPWPRRDERP